MQQIKLTPMRIMSALYLYRNENRNYPGKIRNITFDHIYMKAASSVFLAGEEDARIENITISDLEVTMCNQGTRESGFFDRVNGRVRYEEPYHISRNKLYESEDCTMEEVNLKER